LPDESHIHVKATDVRKRFTHTKKEVERARRDKFRSRPIQKPNIFAIFPKKGWVVE
jgi:hypothetical protein